MRRIAFRLEQPKKMRCPWDCLRWDRGGPTHNSLIRKCEESKRMSKFAFMTFTNDNNKNADTTLLLIHLLI